MTIHLNTIYSMHSISDSAFNLVVWQISKDQQIKCMRFIILQAHMDIIKGFFPYSTYDT